MDNLNTSLSICQVELNAPKGQYNKFGKYNYRSCEDILTGVKPLLKAHNLSLTITDEIIAVGHRIYVKATATIANSQESLSVSAMAREPEEQKGMSASQITGTASSYARKYALNGLFSIDDTKDADSNEHQQVQQPQQYQQQGGNYPQQNQYYQDDNYNYKGK